MVTANVMIWSLRRIKLFDVAMRLVAERDLVGLLGVPIPLRGEHARTNRVACGIVGSRDSRDAVDKD
jgi:hypothetical protein